MSTGRRKVTAGPKNSRGKPYADGDTWRCLGCGIGGPDRDDWPTPVCSRECPCPNTPEFTTSGVVWVPEWAQASAASALGSHVRHDAGGSGPVAGHGGLVEGHGARLGGVAAKHVPLVTALEGGLVTTGDEHGGEQAQGRRRLHATD